MSDTIWLDVQGRPRDDLPPDNTIMLQLQDQLDRLAGKLNVAKLSEFYDYSELELQYAKFLDNEEDDAEVASAGDNAEVSGSWFAPEPALAAVRALHAHLAQHPADLGFQPDACEPTGPRACSKSCSTARRRSKQPARAAANSAFSSCHEAGARLLAAWCPRR
jgi:hypothetical protein